MEDLKEIDNIINKHKVEAQDPDEIDYAEFVDYDDNPNEGEDLFEFEEFDFPSFAKTDITKFNTYAPSQFLTDNEKRVVDSCTDPMLKQILLLNRTKNIQLMQLYKKIKDLLVECQANIAMNEETIINMKTKRACPKIWRLGIPYFKSADDYPCPRNADVIRKHRNGELLFYDMTPSSRWVERDMNRLSKGVSFQYKIYRESELQTQIRELESENTPDHGSDEMIQELKNKLEDVRNSEDDCCPPFGCEKYINWTRISEQFFKERYSAQDCQIFWRTYLHPDINKSPWTKQENEKLKSLVSANNYQNWDHIAEELGGNRTGFIACVHYYYKIEPPRLGGRFTPEEDKQLCDLVEKYRQGEYVAWTKIAHHFSGRTRGQLFYRHRYFLSCRQGTLKGKFSEAEDILTLVLVDRFGKKFTKCGKYFPNRSVVQIKARYSSNLKRALKKGSFTIDEDNHILDYVEKNGYGNWEPMVKVLNRCGTQIRQRYNTLVAFQNANPGIGIEKAPRRRFSGISFNTEYDYLRLMADKFKNYEKIPTLQEIERLLESNPKPEAKPLKPLSRSRTSRVPKEIDHQSSVPTPARESDVGDKSGEPSEGQPDTIMIDDIKSADSDNDETPLPSLVVDDLITDFFCNSMKLHFEQNVMKDHVHKAASAISSILSVLQAELYIPINYQLDSRLDAIDLDIIEVLKEDKPITINDEYVMKRCGEHVERMIPPNLNTMIGMRGLLIKDQIYKDKCSKRGKEHMEKQVLWCINNHLSNQTDEVRNEIILERAMFFRRFTSLFKFPAIMSLVAPSKHLEAGARQAKDDNLNGVRTYKKRPKPHPKKIETNPAPFEGVFIVQSQEGDYEIDTGPDPLRHTAQTSHFCIGTSGDSDEMIVSRLQSVPSVKQDPEVTPKLSMADQLKRKINQTLHDLTRSPPSKRYFQQDTGFMKRNSDRTITTVVDPDISSNKSIATVIKKNVQGSKRKRRENREDVIEKAPVVIPPAPVRVYVRKGNKGNVTTPSNMIAKPLIKTENVVSNNLFPGEAQSNFNLATGELILDNDSSPGKGTTSTNQDLQDLKLLDEVLKKERNAIDESFDF